MMHTDMLKKFTDINHRFYMGFMGRLNEKG